MHAETHSLSVEEKKIKISRWKLGSGRNINKERKEKNRWGDKIG